jgi:hypothetical protein
VRNIQPQLDAPASVALMQPSYDIFHELHTLAGKFLASTDRDAMLVQAHTIRQQLLLDNYG